MLGFSEGLYLDFNAAEIQMLPPRERRDICIRLAEHAQTMGASAPSVQREILLNIASLWLHLADLMDLQ